MGAAHLDDLPAVEDLYDYRGKVPTWLPYQQGDVFRDISLPGLEPGPAMLFMHPCTMRQGTRLRDRLTVVQVRVESSGKVLTQPIHWAARNKVMPLPDLADDGRSTHVGDFMEMATVTVAELPRTARVAQLSVTGRLHMQQRLVFHFTRYRPSIDDLGRATEAVELEAQQQADWLQAGCCGDDDAPADLVEKLEAEYQAFLGDSRDPSSVRGELYGPSAAQAVRRIQREIALRFPRLA